MKTISISRRIVRQSNRVKAFTLIELLTVMAIILVLAGLILNIAGSASYNSAKSRAQGEIGGFSAALENYKADNGAYPQNSDTNSLNPAVSFEPSAYVAASAYLFQELSGYRKTVSTTVPSKAYIFFKPNQLLSTDGADKPALSGTPSPADPTNYKNALTDPFGFCYGYSTKYTAMQAANPSTTPSPATWGYNPTYDLWSTAGYAKAGKATPSKITNPNTAAACNLLWVKNW